jgi:hypothetical protein
VALVAAESNREGPDGDLVAVSSPTIPSPVLYPPCVMPGLSGLAASARPGPWAHWPFGRPGLGGTLGPMGRWGGRPQKARRGPWSRWAGDPLALLGY